MQGIGVFCKIRACGAHNRMPFTKRANPSTVNAAASQASKQRRRTRENERRNARGSNGPANSGGSSGGGSSSGASDMDTGSEVADDITVLRQKLSFQKTLANQRQARYQNAMSLLTRNANVGRLSDADARKLDKAMQVCCTRRGLGHEGAARRKGCWKRCAGALPC